MLYKIFKTFFRDKRLDNGINNIFFRLTRTKTINHLGGYTQVDSQLDFMGKTLATETRHKRLSGDVELLTKEEFTYSAQDRLLTHTHQINGGTKQLLAKNTYDELGQLIAKNVGGTDVTGTTSLQKVDYKYNIRGWLKDINDVMNLGTDLFAFKISYNDPATTSKALFNGNISETYWKTSGDLNRRKYEYQYDHLNRLLNAVYKLPDSNIDQKESYQETIAYDKNGNITNLKRWGAKVSTSVPQMDDLIYTYDTSIKNGNRLLRVTDSKSTAGFKNGSNTDDDYAYDANGNMITDKNKGITAISYNQLNLPVKIEFGTNKIEYLYNATGQKVQKKVTISGTPTTTDYLGGYQYKNNVLEYFPHAEGYVKRETSGTYNYVFNYTDHLGNVRISYSDTNKNGIVDKSNNEILEESNYYPFGLKHEGYNSNNYQPSYSYKYNSKELQSELNLNFYDYGFRNYDPALGRWMNMDPLAEKHRRWSPYNYCVDNPVRFIDPDGRDIINITGGVKFTGKDAQIFFAGLQKEIKETGGVKIHFVEEAKTPNIYRHTLNSFRKGKPDVLHYDSDKDRRAQRRKEATSVLPTKSGFERDEYPYASTFEGGKGADVAYVPTTENRSQGGSLGALYKTMKQGEAFMVVPVPKDKEPDMEPVPDPVTSPFSRPIPAPSPEQVKPVVTTATILTIIAMILLAPVGI